MDRFTWTNLFMNNGQGFHILTLKITRTQKIKRKKKNQICTLQCENHEKCIDFGMNFGLGCIYLQRLWA